MGKRKVWTEADIERVKEVYASGILQGDGKLDSLAAELEVLKSNLVRKAKQLGLTDQCRGVTEESKVRTGIRIKAWLETHEHPKGFLGHTHSEKTKEILSAISVAYHEGATVDQVAERIDKMLETRKANGNWVPQMRGAAMYSRAKSGKRADMDNMFFRSRTEANYARVLKHKGIKFEYEPKTFWFEGIKKGTRAYIPDFYLPDTDKWHEFKGWLDDKSLVKFKRMKKYHPDVFTKMVIIMERLTPKNLEKLLACGFTRDQVVDFSPLAKQYKDIPNWEDK